MTDPSFQSSSQIHRRKAAERGPIKIALVTVSDTRTPDTDVNAAFIREALASTRHILEEYRLIKDDPEEVEKTLQELVAGDSQVILFNGGTGISSRDTTIDVVSTNLEKTLAGFGELFRMLSYEQVGSAAMFSRATAGVCKGKAILSVPGSPAAVRLAWEELICPEIEHLAWEVTR